MGEGKYHFTFCRYLLQIIIQSQFLGNCPEQRTIIFENPHGAVSDHSNLRNALDALKETSKSLQSEASEKSAGKFAQVVRVSNLNKKETSISK